MQRRPSLAVGVRIGAAIEQDRRQLVVRVDDRERSGRWCRRAASRYVGAGIEQRPGRVDMSAAHGEQERREHAALRARLDVGAGLDQQPDDRRRGSRRPPTSARVCPFHSSLRVDVGAVGQQHLDRRHVAGARRRHQRRLAVRQRRVGVGARLSAAARRIAALPLVAARCSGVTP